MTYKELQAACKLNKLGARGKADELRERLLAANGLDAAPSGVSLEIQVPPTPEPSPPPVPIESAAPLTADVPPLNKSGAHPTPQVPPSRQSRPQAPMLVEDANTNGAAAGVFGAGAQYDARGALIEAADGPETLSSGCDLEVTVLGSGACNPSPWRSASCTALRVRDSFWLFDVGEGTQVQLQKTNVRPSRIDRIFITHAHGDHCFGLPGLLCLIGRGRSPSAPPVQIYGPKGLRAYVKISLAFTGTRMLPAYSVHELHGIPDLRRPGGRDDRLPLHVHPAMGGEWGEVGGTDTMPASDGTWWTLFDDVPADDRGGSATIRVSAAPIHHTVPTVGYIVAEDSKPGRLLVDKVMPLLEANREGIREQFGLRDPRALMKQLTKLGPDEVLTLPDGTRLAGRDVQGDAREGRKVVVLGDCCDAALAEPLGAGADLLVHEATNSYLPQFGDRGGAGNLERETKRHGHSTPQMAGRVAKRMNARALLLTHFSQRYTPNNQRVMHTIAKLAAGEAGLPLEAVAPAYDGLQVPVWSRDRDKPPMPIEATAARAASASNADGDL